MEDEAKEVLQENTNSEAPVTEASPVEDVQPETTQDTESETTPVEATAPVTEAPQKKTCPSCGAEVLEEERFCRQCGTNCEVNLQPNENIAAFNTQLDENKKKKKKKGILILASIILAIVVFIGGKAAIEDIVHAVNSSQITSAVEKYNEGEIEYEEATKKISNHLDSSDPEIVSQAIEAEKTLEVLKTSKDHFQKAETYNAKPDYTNAVLHYSAVIETDANYEAAKQAITDIIPLWKKTIPAEIDLLLKEGKTDDAKKVIENFLKYSDDADIKNIQKFIEAEELYKKGHLNSAQDIYKALPKTLAVNGITVESRINRLVEYSAFVNMCGKWSCTSYYKETKEQWRSGRWSNWYNDGDGEGNSDTLEVKCVINDNGTVTISGTSEYWIYTNYSSINSYLKTDTFTTEFKTTVNRDQANKISYKFSSGDFTKGGGYVPDTQTFTFDGSKFTHTCSIKYHYSTYCDEYYTSRDTFGTRTEKY